LYDERWKIHDHDLLHVDDKIYCMMKDERCKMKDVRFMIKWFIACWWQNLLCIDHKIHDHDLLYVYDDKIYCMMIRFIVWRWLDLLYDERKMKDERWKMKDERWKIYDHDLLYVYDD
jgi:hypothetical protein